MAIDEIRAEKGIGILGVLFSNTTILLNRKHLNFKW
jgi:hypothetical protein